MHSPDCSRQPMIKLITAEHKIVAMVRVLMVRCIRIDRKGVD
jgi:hypothetical protein